MMETLEEMLADWLPVSIRRGARRWKNCILRLPKWPPAYLHPWRRESIHRLRRYQDLHRGERCFVIGNGPSLNKMDLSGLEHEFTFGMNRIYLAFEDWGFSTSYLVSVNDLVIEQCAQDFRSLEMPKFFSWRAHNLLYPSGSPGIHTHFLFTTYSGPTFARDATMRLWEGATVTYVCLQLAFHMGFDEVILIGVDHHFSTQGKPNTTVVSAGEDPNHFSEEYFGEGFRWQLPDLRTSEIAYRKAKDAYQQAGRRILDATVGGELDIFPKVNYQSLFEGK